MKTRIAKAILILLIALALMGGSFYVGSLSKEVQMLRGDAPAAQDSIGEKKAPEPAPSAEVEVAPVDDSDHILGNSDANIALIEYSDFECPFCASFHDTAKQVVEDYDGSVMWVYRHFPLESIHPNARNAAMASECVANEAGNTAFWSYTDMLFDGGDLSEPSLISTASSLGADIATCLQSKETSDLVDEDLTSGKNAGVRGTPGNILLNIETGETTTLPGALPYDQVSEAIDALL